MFKAYNLFNDPMFHGLVVVKEGAERAAFGKIRYAKLRSGIKDVQDRHMNVHTVKDIDEPISELAFLTITGESMEVFYDKAVAVQAQDDLLED